MRDSALKLFLLSLGKILVVQVGEELMRDSALKRPHQLTPRQRTHTGRRRAHARQRFETRHPP